MTIAIIVAMSKELKLLLPLMDNLTSSTHGHLTLHSGNIGNHRVVCMECGIGKVNAAIGATSIIDICQPDLVINTGVAAGAGSDISVMDAVIATGVAHHDFWCLGEEWGTVPGCPQILPALPMESQLPSAPGVKRGLIASGDMFITSAEQINSIKSHFPDTQAVDMESAAIAQTCYVKGVPFFCMRIISDTPWCHHDNSAQYTDFWDEAPRQSFLLVRRLIENL